MHASRDHPWSGEADISRLEGKLATLRQQWTTDDISSSFFFTTVRHVEQDLQQLRNEQAKRNLRAVRAQRDFVDVRERWYGGQLDLSQKRAYIREALHAVVVHPVGRGGRVPFNPDLLGLVWRG